jgi:hypothetical protein
MERRTRLINLSATATLIVLATSSCFCQSEVFTLNGVVKDAESKKVLTKTTIVAKDTLEVGSIDRAVFGKTDARGRYKLSLAYDGVYRVEYWSQGHVIKQVIIDLTRIKDKERGNNVVTLEISLVPMLLHVDYSAYHVPVSVCRFDRKTKRFVWDEEYTQSREVELDKVKDQQLAEQKRQAGMAAH